MIQMRHIARKLADRQEFQFVTRGKKMLVNGTSGAFAVSESPGVFFQKFGPVECAVAPEKTEFSVFFSSQSLEAVLQRLPDGFPERNVFQFLGNWLTPVQ